MCTTLIDAAKRQPLKTEALKRAIIQHRAGTRSCEKHGCYVVEGLIPYESCRMCAQEQEINRLKSVLRAAQETLTREHAALVDYHGDHNEADCETCALIARIADALQ